MRRGVHYKYIFNVLLLKLDTRYVDLFNELNNQSSIRLIHSDLLSGNDETWLGPGGCGYTRYKGNAQKWTWKKLGRLVWRKAFSIQEFCRHIHTYTYPNGYIYTDIYIYKILLCNQIHMLKRKMYIFAQGSTGVNKRKWETITININPCTLGSGLRGGQFQLKQKINWCSLVSSITRRITIIKNG